MELEEKIGLNPTSKRGRLHPHLLWGSLLTRASGFGESWIHVNQKSPTCPPKAAARTEGGSSAPTTGMERKGIDRPWTCRISLTTASEPVQALLQQPYVTFFSPSWEKSRSWSICQGNFTLGLNKTENASPAGAWGEQHKGWWYESQKGSMCWFRHCLRDG